MSSFNKQDLIRVMTLANENQGARSPEWYSQIVDDLDGRGHGFDAIYGAVNQFRLQGAFGGIATHTLIAILEGTTSDRASEAYRKVFNAIKAHGSAHSVCFDDPLIHIVIDRLGGWTGLCHSKHLEPGESMCREFVGAYTAAINRPPAIYPRRLLGIDGMALAAQSTGKADEVRLVGDSREDRERSLRVFLKGEGASENIAELGWDMNLLPARWLVRFFEKEAVLKLEGDKQKAAIAAMTDEEKLLLSDEEKTPLYLPKLRARVGKGLEEQAHKRAAREGLQIRGAVYLPSNAGNAMLEGPEISAVDAEIAKTMKAQSDENLTPLQMRLRAVQGQKGLGKKLDMESSITPTSIRRKEQAAKDIEDKRIFDQKLAGLMARQDKDQDGKRPQA